VLVLSRKSGEEVLIPELGISIKIVGIHGKQVRIALSAPPSVRLYRAEIWKRIREAQSAAAQPLPTNGSP
jgi:carbon storage regulator